MRANQQSHDFIGQTFNLIHSLVHQVGLVSQYPHPQTGPVGMEELHHVFLCSTLQCRGPCASAQRGDRQACGFTVYTGQRAPALKPSPVLEAHPLLGMRSCLQTPAQAGCSIQGSGRVEGGFPETSLRKGPSCIPISAHS